MRMTALQSLKYAIACSLSLTAVTVIAADAPKAGIDGSGPGWHTMVKADFERVNDADDTWQFSESGIFCTGQPVGVIRTKKQYTNFELVVEWMHEKPAGNSGVFVWATPESLKGLPPGRLPKGICLRRSTGLNVRVRMVCFLLQLHKLSKSDIPQTFLTNVFLVAQEICMR